MNKSDAWEHVNHVEAASYAKCGGFVRPFRFPYARMTLRFRTDDCGYHESARPDTTDGAVT